MTTVALVAAKDAAQRIAPTVTALAGLAGIDEVWVVDDGSVDETAAVAAGAGARVVRLDSNVGKGGALAAGVAATPHATRYLLADADLADTATGLRALLDDDASALVIGVLPSAGRRGGFGFVKRFAAAGIRRACGLVTDAPLSGQRVVDAALLRSLTLAPRFGVEVGMTIDAARSGVTVTERPVDVDHAHTGRSWRGFVHRARQGRDIAAALLPRVTSPAQRVGAVAVAAVLVFAALTGLSSATAAPQGVPLGRAQRVVLFAYDNMSLRDLSRADLPALQSLRKSGSTGALNVRTSDRRSLARRRGSDAPSAFDAYASLGASARVRSVPALGRGVANGDGARVIGMIAARRLSRNDRAANPPGALGDALHAAGKRTAVIGPQSLASPSPALAALADHRGGVDVVTADVHTAMRADVVLEDPQSGDLAATDAKLAEVVAARPPHTTLIVFAPTPPGTKWELTPVVINGAGVGRGTIASPSTRRASLGVLTDLAPTTLTLLGVKPPISMTGAALRSTGHRFDRARLERLEVDGAVRARFFESAAVAYTVIGIVFYLGFIAALFARVRGRARRALRTGVCVAAAFPLAMLVTAAGQHWLHRGGESPATLVAVTAGLGLAASRLRRLNPVYWLGAWSVGIILADVAVTGPIHTATLLGYSIQTTGRFYGLPNASFSVFAAGLLLVAAGVAGDGATAARSTGGVGVLAIGTAFLAAPWLGNDVGGTLAMVPVVLACAWVFSGRAITRRVAAIGAALVVAAVAGLVAAEAVFGSGTHLGRVATRGVEDNGSFTTTLLHRFNANFGQLVDQWYGFVAIALVATALFALLVQRRWLTYLPAGSPLRAAIIGILAVSLLGFLANDSGPVVIVLCFVVLAPALALVALEPPVTSTPRALPRK
ncbi:MAG: hypothetical protein QOJ00_2382 [Actinomycetota bacterium]